VLKLIFWSLVAINAAVLAYSQGYLGKTKAGEREPARVKAQLAADKMVLVTAARASAAAMQEKAADEEKKKDMVACAEVGNFSAVDAKKYEGLLAPLELGDIQSKITVPVMEVNQYVVHIPPAANKEAADRKAAELKNLGVTNYFVMSDNSPLKWAISLGVFKSEAAANTLLAGLNKQGVHNARISGRGPMVNKYAYQFRGIDSATRTKLGELKKGMAGIDLRSCKP
jgi:hypothetical protein